MNIIAPCDANEMKNLMPQTVNLKGPLYIRLARGGDKVVTNKVKKITFGKSILFGSPEDILFVTTGITTQECLDVVEKLELKNIKAGVLHNHTIKPFDKKNLLRLANKTKLIVTVEEHIVSGGLGSLVLEILNLQNSKSINNLLRIGIDDKFVKKYGSQKDLLEYCGISKDRIYSRTIKKFNEKN